MEEIKKIENSNENNETKNSNKKIGERFLSPIFL